MIATTSNTLEIKVKMVDLTTAAKYIVNITEEKNSTVKGSLEDDVRCLKYATGPCSNPNDITKSKDPKDHNSPNFRGLRANTGNSKKEMVKQTAEPRRHAINPIRRSNRERVNHSGSCCATESASCCVNGSLLYTSLAVLFKVSAHPLKNVFAPSFTPDELVVCVEFHRFHCSLREDSPVSVIIL